MTDDVTQDVETGSAVESHASPIPVGETTDTTSALAEYEALRADIMFHLQDQGTVLSLQFTAAGATWVLR